MVSPPRRPLTGTPVDGCGTAATEIATLDVDLGYQPYPGTLNLELHEPVDLPRARLHADSQWGVWRFWPATIAGVARHAVRAPKGIDRPTYLEVVAPVRLRDLIDDNATVEVHDG